jgi:hypothetical protein
MAHWDWRVAHRGAVLRSVHQYESLQARHGHAYNHPAFYRQLRKDPEQLMQAALELLARNLSCEPSPVLHRDVDSLRQQGNRLYAPHTMHRCCLLPYGEAVEPMHEWQLNGVAARACFDRR